MNPEQGFPAQIFVQGGPQIIRLNEKLQIITRLCVALHEFLSFDVNMAIEVANWKPPRPPRPTIEDLNRAQQELDAAHTQLAAFEKLADQMPGDYGEAFMEAQRPAIERLIKPLQDYISYIQKAMEEPEPDPGSPWDGSHDIATICATCARWSDQHEHSVQALNVALKESGWGRNAEGDWICQQCLAAAIACPQVSTAGEGSSKPKEDGQ